MEGATKIYAIAAGPTPMPTDCPGICSQDATLNSRADLFWIGVNGATLYEEAIRSGVGLP